MLDIILLAIAGGLSSRSSIGYAVALRPSLRRFS